VGKGGVVRDPALHEDVLTRIIEEAHKMEFTLKGLIKSSVRGQKGNREFFTLWSLREELLDRGKVQKMIKEVVWNEKN
jgi:23S rRNA (cytidine1920-2'-O)/16S rRNA (cytidine1409-2'-O)-methyltransferase